MNHDVLEQFARRFPPVATPSKAERVQRFKVGDVVSIVRGPYPRETGRIAEVVVDPLDESFSHCVGNSAKYRIDGVDNWRWDWMLEAAPTVLEIDLSVLPKDTLIHWVAVARKTALALQLQRQVPERWGPPEFRAKVKARQALRLVEADKLATFADAVEAALVLRNRAFRS